MSLREESMFFVVAVWASLSVLCSQTELNVDSSYVAAVYEHHLFLNPEPHVPTSRPAALLHMQRNLDVYQQQAALAAQQVCRDTLVLTANPVL